MMDSIWRNELIFAMFGILYIQFMLMCAIIALLSIFQTYQMILRQNYHWWWRSFFLGAMGGIYLLIFAIYYMKKYTEFEFGNSFLSEILYVMQMSAISVCFACMCGTVSLLASYVFVERIYNVGTASKLT